MNEIQRQAYLKIMGIQVYFPRSVLPGARPSPVYEIRDDSSQSDKEATVTAVAAPTSSEELRAFAENTESEKSTKRPATPNSGRAAEALTNASSMSQPSPEVETAVADGAAELVAEVAAAPVPVPATQVTAEAESPATEEGELRFRLQYYKIGASLAIIDETPHHLPSTGGNNSGLRTNESRELLISILAALGVDAKDDDLRPELFSWPLVESMSVQGDPVVAARNALQGFIQSRHDKDKFSNLVIFAGQIATLVELPQESISLPETAYDFSHKRDSADSEFFITLTNSLHSMLAFPLLKRDVWQQLQALRKRLVSSDSVQSESAPQ